MVFVLITKRGCENKMNFFYVKLKKKILIQTENLLYMRKVHNIEL